MDIDRSVANANTWKRWDESKTFGDAQHELKEQTTKQFTVENGSDLRSLHEQ